MTIKYASLTNYSVLVSKILFNLMYAYRETMLFIVVEVNQNATLFYLIHEINTHFFSLVKSLLLHLTCHIKVIDLQYELMEFFSAYVYTLK